MAASKDVKRLLIMNASSNIIFNYIGIFVNLYIWEQSRKIFDVAWFNLILFIVWSFSFVAASKLVQRYHNRLLIRVVACGGAATFLLLTFLQLDSHMLWISIIAAPVGMMWGFYTSAQNITLSVMGKGRDFVSYFSMSSIIAQTISIANPIVFAFVIKWIGFSGSFLLMFLFVTVLLVVSFFIPRISLADEKESLFKQVSFRSVFRTSSLRWLVPSCLTAGVFLQFQGLFALIYTFSVSNDKLIIALLNVMYACSTIVAMFLFRMLRVATGIWLKIGMVAVSAGFLLPLVPKAPLLVLSNVLTTMGMFYFGTIWNTEQFSAISRCSRLQQIRLFMWREWLLNIMRIGLLTAVLPLRDFRGPWFVTILLVALLCALAIPYFSMKGNEALARESETA